VVIELWAWMGSPQEYTGRRLTNAASRTGLRHGDRIKPTRQVVKTNALASEHDSARKTVAGVL